MTTKYRSATCAVAVESGATPGPEALAVFLFDDGLDLVGNPPAPHAGFVADARRAFGNESVRAAVAAPAGEETSARLALHTGSAKGWPPGDAVRMLASRALQHARSFGLREVCFALGGPDGPRFAPAAAEGAAIGSYRFTHYRKDPGKPPPVVRILVGEDALEDAAASVEAARGLAVEVNRARDLINEPAEAVFPETLAEEARQIAAETGLGVEVWDDGRLRSEGYPGLISVGQGSHRPPRMIVLRHRPDRPRGDGAHLALVGKGITFDTGGISLKPPKGMWTMKGDMSGSAAVLRAMSAVARAGLPVTVTGIVAAAENYPGRLATRPGDIFVARNGKSVMVDNTDAEGRLVLTDALARAGEEGATHIVDIATLTGACVRALGTGVAGIMGNDPELIRDVIAAGAVHGEALWELPLVEEYRGELKTDSADLKNIGGINAGTITAALFLEEFVPEGTRWAHLDIAGPFLVERPWKYFGKGGTGFGTRTLYQTAADFGMERRSPERHRDSHSTS